MDIEIGDVIVPSDKIATIHTQTGNIVIDDAQITVDEASAKVTVGVGKTLVPTTGRVILNAPGFNGWTGELAETDSAAAAPAIPAIVGGDEPSAAAE